jgi:hypothetical protein
MLPARQFLSLSLLMAHLLCCLLCCIVPCYFIPHLILWPAFSAHNLFNSAQEISYIFSSCFWSSKVPTSRLTWCKDLLAFRWSWVWNIDGKSNLSDSWSMSNHWRKNNDVLYSKIWRRVVWYTRSGGYRYVLPSWAKNIISISVFLKGSYTTSHPRTRQSLVAVVNTWHFSLLCKC